MRSPTLAAAWRRLRARPRTSAFTLLLLAVGVGLPTALFSLLDGVLLRGLPFPEGDRIVRVSTLESFDVSVPAEDFTALSDAVEAAAREGRPVLDALAGGLSLNTVVTRPGVGSKGMTGTYVTVNMFPMLGVEPVLGRGFTPDDARPGAPPVVIISHRLWRRWFGGDSSVLGETVIVNREPMTVVGVMPPGFQFPVRQEVWTPLRREGWWARVPLFAVGRLAPGVDVAAAERALAPVATALDEEHPLPAAQGERRIGVAPFVRTLVPPEIDRSLRLMLWAVLGVLLIACGNVAGLRLGDALAQRRELAVRRALGARAGQLLRPLLAEAAVLTAAGAAAGIALAWLLVHLAAGTVLRGSMMERLFWVDVRLDARACGFAVAAAALAALLGTLPPALWSLARRDLALGSGAPSRGTGGRGGMRLAGALVVAQVAVCFVLVSASALLVASGRSLLSRPQGFDPDGLLRVMVNPYQADWKGPEAPRAFWARLLPRLKEDPAIAGATVANGIPWASPLHRSTVGVATGSRLGAAAEGAAGSGPDALPPAALLRVLPGFFHTLRLPILAGRGFTPRDVETVGDRQAAWTQEAEGTPTAAARELPAVVSAGFALRHLGPHPLGEPLALVSDSADRTPLRARVVGIAADRTARGVEDLPPDDRVASTDTVYLPLAVDRGGSAFLIVRSAGGATAAAEGDGGLLRHVDRAIAGVDPLVATLDPATYQEDRAETVWAERRLAELFSLFAVASLVLSGVGLFGVAVLSLRRRLRELAIRAALGARPVDLRAILLRQGLAWIACGLAGGAGLAWLTHRLLRAFLHGVAPWDPALTGASAALVILALLAAVAGPAHRAARTDPATVLDAE